MHATDKTQTPSHESTNLATGQDRTEKLGAPTLIAPEWLQFIGGGKGVPATPANVSAPRNTW